MPNSFDTHVHCDELIPACPFCDEPLDGEIIDGLHAECNRKFGEELQEAFPDPDDVWFEDLDEFLPIGDEEPIEFQIEQMLKRFV